MHNIAERERAKDNHERWTRNLWTHTYIICVMN